MLIVGQRLQERYEIEAVLGEGGMGRVYRARHTQRAITVAIKEIACPDETYQRAVRAEAETLSRLSHPNLPRVYDFLQESDYCYIVMEFVKGATMNDALNSSLRRPTEAMVLNWAKQLCAVLRYLHGHKPPVIFKDLKPSNIMLSGDRLKLIDFGISKTMETPDDVTRTVSKGAISPGYAPPEQYSGGTDMRSDIYALGATLYALCTGVRPPDSTDIAARVHLPVPVRQLNADISERTAAIINWMMQMSPSDRPQSMDEVSEAFAGKRWVPSETSKASLESAATARPRSLAVPLAVVGAVLVTLLALGVASWRRARPSATAVAQPSPTAAAGRLKIDTTPEKVSVILDGHLLGVTPLDTEVPDGIHKLALRLKNYDSIEKSISIKRGATEDLSMSLTAQPAHLAVSGLPAGASVRIDDAQVGMVDTSHHLQVTAAPGQHLVSWACSGYNGGTSQLLLTAGQTHAWKPLVHRSQAATAITPAPVQTTAVPTTQPPTATVPAPPSRTSATSSAGALSQLGMASEIQPGIGVGDITLGESFEEVVRAHPALHFADVGSTSVSASKYEHYYSPEGAITVWLNRNNKIVSLGVAQSGGAGDINVLRAYHTPGGVHIYSTLAEVTAEFGDSYTAKTEANGNTNYVYKSQGIRFTMSADGHVRSIIAIRSGNRVGRGRRNGSATHDLLDE